MLFRSNETAYEIHKYYLEVTGVQTCALPISKLLVGLLVVFVLATSALTFLYVRSVQKLNRLQLQNALIVRNRALVNSLAAESIEYSKRNPALDPVLQSVGIKPKGSGAPSQPASRP